MAQIFEGSFLTIGALISRDDTNSLFFKDERHAPSLKSHVAWTKDGMSYVVYSRIPLDYHLAERHGLRRDCDRFPLMTRAWVYQERLLAPRVLYFGEELSWECRKASTCECSEAKHGTKHGHSLSLSTAYSIEKLYLQWQEMVEDFTSLKLSQEEDRLPALSGLAQQYQPRLKSEYLAGIWRKNLVDYLIWYAYPAFGIEAPRYRTKRPGKWRAPSWSWASVEGPISFSRGCGGARGGREKEAEILAVSSNSWIEIISTECIPSSVDPTGTVSNGRLVINGSGRPAVLRHQEDCAGRETRHFSVKRRKISSFSVCSNFTVDEQEAYVDYDLIEHGLMEPNSDMSIYCLYLAGMTSARRTLLLGRGEYILSPLYTMWSLLLRCLDDGTFERVGLLMSEYCDGNEVRFRDSLHKRTITIV